MNEVRDRPALDDPLQQHAFIYSTSNLVGVTPALPEVTPPAPEVVNEENVEAPDSVIDEDIFRQILEMDDDDDNREFSRSLVDDFLIQAETACDKMKQLLSDGDFVELSKVGHFLKGSSATLGLLKMKESCEKIQTLGEKDAAPREDISKVLENLSTEYERARNYFGSFYLSESGEEPPKK